MLFAAGVLFALFFRFLHTLLLLVLKTPDVKIALEHNKHKHGGGQSKQPRKLLYARLKICKVIENLKNHTMSQARVAIAPVINAALYWRFPRFGRTAEKRIR